MIMLLLFECISRNHEHIYNDFERKKYQHVESELKRKNKCLRKEEQKRNIPNAKD